MANIFASASMFWYYLYSACVSFVCLCTDYMPWVILSISRKNLPLSRRCAKQCHECTNVNGLFYIGYEQFNAYPVCYNVGWMRYTFALFPFNHKTKTIRNQSSVKQKPTCQDMFFNLMSTFDGVTCVLALFVVIFVDQECLIQLKKNHCRQTTFGQTYRGSINCKGHERPQVKNHSRHFLFFQTEKFRWQFENECHYVPREHRENRYQ